MNFEESLNYLYGLQLFGVKLGLENMQALKRRLPLLQEDLPSVHVAGTNGKGSVSAMLAEILRQAGYKVGLYTSPHLHCFSERIRINGSPVSKDEIVTLTQEVQVAAADLPVTFFEATTAMALLAFNKHQVDMAVIETGLGGRLDATNIVIPQLCLITPVSFDHCEYLGETLPDIAAEKAGIIKPGVPVVVGKQQPEALDVIQSVAARMHAQVVLAGRDYNWSGAPDLFTFEGEGCRLDRLACRLPGRHQVDNYAQAIAAAEALKTRGLVIPDFAVRQAGQSVFWPGRLEWWGENRTVLVDVAHNQAGMETLAVFLDEQGIGKVHLVAGLSGERQANKVLNPLVKFVASLYSVPVSYNQSVSPASLCEWAEQNCITCRVYPTAEEGMRAALEQADSSTPVLVCGSLYLVAELRKLFGGASEQSS